MEEKKNKQILLVAFVMLTAIIPLLMHIGWFLHSYFYFAGIKSGKDVTLIKLHREGASDPDAFPIQIIGTYGDIFQPQLRGLDRSYDLIVLSATLDPLYSINEMLVWESNLLVRAFFEFAYNDESLKNSGIKNLIIRMVRNNKAFIKYISSEPISDIPYNQNYTAELCEPLIEKVPKDSRLYRVGIKWYAVLPLFNSKCTSDANERKKRLALNVKLCIFRLLNDLNRLENVQERLRVIAIPALAGSETLEDSHYYLKYADSFESIISAIKAVSLPKSLEKIYLVVWDKWEYCGLPEEGERAVSGLREAYNRFMFPELGIKLISYSVLFSFTIAYFIFWLKLNTKTSRDWTELIAIVLGSQLGNFIMFGNLISMLLKRIYNFNSVLLIVVEIFLGLFAVFLAYKLAQKREKL